MLYSSSVDFTTEEKFDDIKLQLASESNASTGALRLVFRELHTSSCAEQEPVAVHTLTDEVFVKKTNVTAGP